MVRWFGLILLNFNQNPDEDQCLVLWLHFGRLEIFLSQDWPGSLYLRVSWIIDKIFFTVNKYSITFILGIGFVTPYFKYNSWRIFLLLCALPSFVVTGLLFYLPESPKFLIMQGRRDKALNILRNIFVTNTGESYSKDKKTNWLTVNLIDSSRIQS